jgi:hypothetical protein
MRMLVLLLLLGACAAPEAAGPTRESETLQRDLAGRTAGPPQSCIPALNSAQSLRIVDAHTIVYESGRALWVNPLDGDCPGMRPMDALIVDVHGSQYCRGDRFRPVSTGSTIPGPTCVLGDFTPYRKAG